MEFGRLLMGSFLIAGLLAVAPVATAQDGGGGGGRVRHQDPGSGGSGGGDPCSISQMGWCESMTIYQGDYECIANWCAPDPAAMLKCTSYNTPTCQHGTDADGEPIYVQINDCAYCPD